MLRWRYFSFGIVLALAASPLLSARGVRFNYDPGDDAPLLTVEKSGSISTKQGLSLELKADPGNVRVFTDESTRVSYHVLVEADSRDPGAEQFLRQLSLSARHVPQGIFLEARLPWQAYPGRFSVSVEVHVPRRYNLKIDTRNGNIALQDLEGSVNLTTGGGDIAAGNVSPQAAAAAGQSGNFAARIETQGGNISVGDVAGSLRAITAGGHIRAGDIAGDAFLRTGGGQIEARRITGAATLETNGGNIRVSEPGSSTIADTDGGEISFDETSGTIRKRSGVGAIHIDRVTGPTAVTTNGGRIFLSQLNAPLSVSSGEGDMIVDLPRQLPATIDAVVERGGEYGIVADPSLPLRISDQDSGGGNHALRGQGNLNGGGETLRVQTVAGNIVLKLGERGHGSHAGFHPAWVSDEPEPLAVDSWNPEDNADGFFEEVRRRIFESWWGGVPVDAGEMQKHMEHSVAPVYPDVAREAGIEGDVTLRVYVSSDGRVTNISVLDGPPILARAAAEAVQQWRYDALRINGQPVSVVTTLVVAFRLK